MLYMSNRVLLLDTGDKPDSDAWFVLGFLARDKHCAARPIAVLRPTWVHNMTLQPILVYLIVEIWIIAKSRCSIWFSLFSPSRPHVPVPIVGMLR